MNHKEGIWQQTLYTDCMCYRWIMMQMENPTNNIQLSTNYILSIQSIHLSQISDQQTPNNLPPATYLLPHKAFI